MPLPVPQKLHLFDPRPEWKGMRLKEVLLQSLPGVSGRSLLRMVMNGLVSSGEARLEDLDAPVPMDSTLQVDLRHGVEGRGQPSRPDLRSKIRVLHDDDDVVVVAKAAGVAVQPEEDDDAHDVPLVELLKHYWRARKAPILNPILVQRLDKDTSGLLVLAKNLEAGRILQAQLTSRDVHRVYHAIVRGRMTSNEGTWSSSLGRDMFGRRRSVESDLPRPPRSGQPAITHYRVLKFLQHATLIECRLETGRTHQIRIHCAEAGHPVLGDRIYTRLADDLAEHARGGKPGKVPRGRAEGSPRLFLHAARLEFEHPATGQPMSFEDPPPEAFQKQLELLRESRH